MVDEKRPAQAGDSVLGEGRRLAAVGTVHLLLLGVARERLQTALAEDVEALEELGVLVVLQTHGTRQLLLQLLQRFLGRRRKFSHFTGYRQ